MQFTAPQPILDAWLRAVNRGDPREVAALYSEHAILLPTFSHKFLRDLRSRAEYFQWLAEQRGLQVALREDTLVVQGVSAARHCHCLSGVYDWNFEVGGEARNFAARFTFIVDVSLPQPIVHHHSSSLPQQPVMEN